MLVVAPTSWGHPTIVVISPGTFTLLHGYWTNIGVGGTPAKSPGHTHILNFRLAHTAALGLTRGCRETQLCCFIFWRGKKNPWGFKQEPGGGGSFKRKSHGNPLCTRCHVNTGIFLLRIFKKLQWIQHETGLKEGRAGKKKKSSTSCLVLRTSAT